MHNSKEWQRPDEFLIDRFDPKSPLYLTPGGKKRNAFSWLPFSGGKRVCFGKTFAEANLKFLTTYITQTYDFEFEEPELYKDAYPESYVFYPHNRPLNLKIKKRQD